MCSQLPTRQSSRTWLASDNHEGRWYHDIVLEDILCTLTRLVPGPWFCRGRSLGRDPLFTLGFFLLFSLMCWVRRWHYWTMAPVTRVNGCGTYIFLLLGHSKVCSCFAAPIRKGTCTGPKCSQPGEMRPCFQEQRPTWDHKSAVTDRWTPRPPGWPLKKRRGPLL